jgi:predicted nucleic acid-binding protein
MKTKSKTRLPVDKIAVDTAIWLKALLFGGSAEELIKMSLTGKVEVLTTDVQFADLARVLSERLGFSETAIAEVRIFMESATTLVEAPALPAAGPGENLSPLLRVARESQVSAIATCDRSKLMGMNEFEGIPIVTVS